MPDHAPAVAPHFESSEREAHAARLGMWVFLGSEVLLFAGLFALLATYRMHYPAGFREGVLHNTKVLGSLNTAVLLVSSTLVASSVQALRAGRARAATVRLLATACLGVLFLIIKLIEYAAHFREGIYPGGEGSFFSHHPTPGLPLFWTLYFVATGLHAVHVTAGMTLLLVVAVAIARGRVSASRLQRLELAAIYWHLVDLVWIFLWPLFYLA